MGRVRRQSRFDVGFATDSGFFQSYLMSFLFWLGLSLGAPCTLRLRDLARHDRVDELTFELPLVGGDAPVAITSASQV